MRSFLDFTTGHWYFAFPMFLMSFVGLTLMIWRILLNLNAKTSLSEFLPQFQDVLDKEGVDGALQYCQARTDVIPNKLYVAGLETSGQGLAASRRAMANVAELEILPDLNFLLPAILAIAKIATMVGLLGTVLSMINVFDIMQSARGGDPREQSREIGLALFATALGLVTAIPLVFAHVLFKAWVARFEVTMKSAANKLLVLLTSLRQSGKTSGTASAASGSGTNIKSGTDPATVPKA